MHGNDSWKEVDGLIDAAYIINTKLCEECGIYNIHFFPFMHAIPTFTNKMNFLEDSVYLIILVTL